MCKLFLTNGTALGSRMINWECYDPNSKGFLGMSETELIKRLKQGEKQLYGFKISKGENGADTLELDGEGFNMTNVQIRSGVNSLKFLKETDCDINTALIVVAAFKENGKHIFETVNARHARVTYSEEKLRMLIELGVPVAGVRMSKGKLTVCEGVEDLDKKEGVVNE